MLGPDETWALTGHPVGGVCPFGLAHPAAIYCDVAPEFDTVFPAAGSLNSSVRVSPRRLTSLSIRRWVNVCRLPDGETRT